MKRYAFKTVVAVLLMSAICIAGITAIRLSQRDTQFKATQIGLKMMLQIQASALNDGYFSWTELQNLVKKNDLPGARDQLQEIYDLYPFIEEIDIQPGDPPQSAYEITGSNSSLRMRFGLKDDFGGSPLPGWEAVATINAQRLLDALQSESKLVIDPISGHELAFSIMASYKDPLLNWLDYLLIVSVTIAVGYAVSAWLWRRNIYFYETKGLESIIFLFEQTEHVSANHSRRVAALTMFMGERMGYKGRRLRNLYTAALLHDIGKISVPSSLLLKEGPLTKQEQQAVAAHPIISARILKNFKELSHLSSIVLYHHERMDGSGYPEGLTGKEIPEESRIIAVVDVFEALVGDRPYRNPVEPAEAFSMMRSMPLDQLIVELLSNSYAKFKKFQAPKWVIAYHHNLEKI
ncbi:MAG: HD-GYP domain-containing protein [Spirochaetales bacterium]|jgi:HD-GYP domain-containing protein (c-di-GMP phosphodiesterase class II)